MTKRPPEMVELDRWDLAYCGIREMSPRGEYLDADEALAAVRSLRVKLFRERADLWSMRGTSALCGTVDDMKRCIRRSQRFHRIADAIERGER